MSQRNTPEASGADPPSSNVSVVVQTSQAAMQQQQDITPTASPVPLPDTMRDIVMTDDTSESHSPALAHSTNAPSPLPPRNGTPNRSTNGTDVASRAASQHPDPISTIPKEAPPHGAPTRQYLNNKVTGVLLEGMKQLAREQPKEPLRVLGEYLLQRSKELEGGN